MTTTKQRSFWELELRRYLSSLQQLWHQKSVLLIDLLSFSAVLFLFFLFEQVFTVLSARLLPSQSEAQLQELLLFGSETQLQQILQGLRLYVVFFVLGFLCLLIISALLIACSRSYIWKKLHQKSWERKLEWGWIWLLLLLALVFVVFFLPVLFINTLIQLLFQILTPNVTIHEIVSLALVLVWIVLYVFYILTVKYSYHHTHNSWASLGDGFKLLWKHRAKSAVALLASTITITVLNFAILYPLSKVFTLTQVPALIAQFLMLVLFIAWLRFYLLSIFKEA